MNDFQSVEEAKKKLYEPYHEKIREYFMASKAPGTIEQYVKSFEKVEKWCKAVGVSYLPLHIDDCLTYLVYLSETAESFAAVKMAKYAILFAHQCDGHVSPTLDPAVNLVLEASKRKWARPVQKAKPMTVEIIKLLVDEVLGSDIYKSKGNFEVPITEWRTVINIVVKFAFVARNSDVLNLTLLKTIFIM